MTVAMTKHLAEASSSGHESHKTCKVVEGPYHCRLSLLATRAASIERMNHLSNRFADAQMLHSIADVSGTMARWCSPE